MSILTAFLLNNVGMAGCIKSIRETCILAFTESRIMDSSGFHWDTGETYGTANPLEAICECPISSLNEYYPSAPNVYPAQNQELFEWIELQAKLLGVAPESC